MKHFFEVYVAMPLTVLLLFFITPTAMFGGIKLATTLFDMTPACEVRE